MKIILTLPILLLGFCSFGQITLDVNDFMEPGDSVGIYELNSFSINYEEKGPDVTWDFSDLNSQNKDIELAPPIASAGFIINIQFGGFASPQYKSDYYQPYDGLPLDQLSNIIPNLPIDGMNRVIKIEDNQITYPGYSVSLSGNQIGIRSDTIERGYALPINYGDSVTSRARTHFSFSPFFEQAEIIQYRQRTSIVDSYGTVITPYGEFDALRIHHTIKEKDSVRIEIGPFNQWIPINRTLNEYEWWGKEMKRPILRIETEGVFGAEIVKNVSYIDNDILGIATENNSLETILYPNPSDDYIFVNTDINIDEIVLYNSLGKEVLHESHNANQIKIDIRQLNAGVYQLHINTKNGSAVRTIVVK